jgi:NADPH-dependent glutamate synthase beta subunit-like oxidoreductase/2,4-dienoyl-CoA reductase-like NADH-dependent reductase (Old Yellow Enzyme family)
MKGVTKSKYAFKYRTLKSFIDDVKALGYSIPVSGITPDGISLLKSKVSLRGGTIPNRLCIQPVEGCDGEPDGSPGKLTIRRYERFAKGGSGLIWVEATAVTREGKANPRQLWINENSAPGFKKLVDMIRELAVDENGERQNPYIVLQLTHSGRYSKPEGIPKPLIMYHSPILDPTHGLTESYPVVSDEYLDALQQKYVTAAKLAYDCGFDAVDIKSCHGYLLHEMLSAYTRKDSKYAGSFENRTRFMTEVIERIKNEVPGIAITTRLNVYDAYPYPYGFGMKEDGSMEYDLTEPIKLIGRLKNLGVDMINVCVGNPYYNPHVERPYDFPIQGLTVPDINPLEIIEKNIKITEEIARSFPDMIIVGTGFSWLRQICVNVGLAMIENGQCDIFGVGRLAFAHPDYANELLKTGAISPEKCCITCSSCTQIMRDGGMAGCVIRDAEVYEPIYYQGRLKSREFIKGFAQSCYNCWGAACQAGCPAGIDIPGFINAFDQGNVKEAYELIRESNVLPETCAYTCPVEELCEKNCTAGILNRKSVPIHEIQKHIAVEARKNGWTKVKAGSPAGKKVAVIGFGPAGIACSTRLVEKGVYVTVFEASDGIGGTASALIPTERLPGNVLEEEVASFGLGETGLFELRLNNPIGEDLDLDSIMKEGYDAVFIAAGMSEGSGLPFDSKPEGVYSATDFLPRCKRGDFKAKAGDKAVVIGGGNTAMDVAVSLKNLGVRDVFLVYRRSFMELPAWTQEVTNALEKGVHFLVLNQPVGYVEDMGKLTGVKLQRTTLGEPDATGRPAPVLIEGSEYVLPATICVEATGQKVPGSLAKALNGVEFVRGKIRIARGKHGTTRDRVFAGGDIINGGMTVVQAVREGMDAADEICETLGV